MNALTAAQILSIPEPEPERLFGSPDAIHDLYRSLAQRWHPDTPDGDAEVFAHIAALAKHAKHLVEVGRWHSPGLFEFTAGGKQYRVHYVRAFDFELGKALLGKSLITYVIRKEFADLAEKARLRIAGFKYPTHSATKEALTRYLPKVVQYHETPHDVVISIDKPADLIRLRDLVDHAGGKLDPKHVAWIVSRMLNHASYLEWAKLSHHDISMDTLFICPEHHTVCLLGGWWYTAEIGTNLKGAILPMRTIVNGSNELLTKKLATLRTDGELVRLTARELLGDGSGVKLMSDPAIPKAMLNWLRMSGSGSAQQDYAEWREKILPASFGPRKFVRWPVTAADVYAELAA